MNAWDHEPDHARWDDKATGLACVVHRNPNTGNLCGYVRVPAEHPFHGTGYSHSIPISGKAAQIMQGTAGKRGIIDLFIQAGNTETTTAGFLFDVHGGITYSGFYPPGEDKADGEWWYGFDCGHAGDLSPKYSEKYPDLRPVDGEVYRTIEYVMAECASLAKQISEYQ